MGPGPDLPPPLLVTNEQIAQCIAARLSSESDQSMLDFLDQVLNTIVFAAHSTGPGVDEYHVPTLAGPYLSRIFERMQHDTDFISTLTAKTTSLILTLSEDSQPLCLRVRGAVLLIHIFRSLPLLAPQLFSLNSATLLAPISNALVRAASDPHEEDYAALTVTYIDLVSHAAAHSSLRHHLVSLIPSLSVLLGSPSARARTLTINALTKLTGSSNGLVSRHTHAGIDETNKLIGSLASKSIDFAFTHFLSKSTPWSEKESLMESLALLSCETSLRGQIARSTGLSAMIELVRSLAFLANITPSFVLGFAAFIHHLTMYPSNCTEQLADHSRTHHRVYSKSDENALGKDPDDHVSLRCMLLMDHKVVQSLTALYRALSRAPQYQFSKPLKTMFGTIVCNLARTPTFNGHMVQQGCVSILTRFASSDLNSAHALAKLSITLAPNIVYSNSQLVGASNAIWTLVPCVQLASSGGLEEPAQVSQMAHFQALLALTNLATAPGMEISKWLVRLEQSESLVCDHADIRRAAWELVCNMIWSDGSVLVQCVQSPRRVSLLIDMGIAHSHVDEDFQMRRCATGVLAALSSEMPCIRYLTQRSPLSEGNGIETTRLHKLWRVTRDEAHVEILHRLCQFWVNVVGDETCRQLVLEDIPLKDTLGTYLASSNGHVGVARIVESVLSTILADQETY